MNYFLALGCNGGDSCCTKDKKCSEEQGDCDSDDECQEGLSCGTDNCSKKEGGDWDAADDCCYKPAGHKLNTSL